MKIREEHDKQFELKDRDQRKRSTISCLNDQNYNILNRNRREVDRWGGMRILVVDILRTIR